jgi:hypothetical protein
MGDAVYRAGAAAATAKLMMQASKPKSPIF